MLFDDYDSVDDFLLNSDFRKWVIDPEGEDVIHVKNWTMNHPEKKGLWENAAEIIRLVEFDTIEEASKQTEQQWEKIESELYQNDDEYQDKTTQTRRSAFFINVYLHRYKIAALIPIILITVFLAFYLQEKGSYKIYETGYGEKQRIEMADGSILTLNANSKLKIKIDLENRKREVWLDGEAFFEINRLEEEGHKIPFLVKAGAMNIEVLGTGFNVFNRKKKVQVVLEHGSVAIDGNNIKALKMEPGDLVELNGLELRKGSVNPENYRSWKENKWIFTDARLIEITYKIEEYYGIQVSIEDENLARETMSGALPTTNLKTLLEGLSMVYGLDILEDKNQLIIKRKNK